MPKIMAVSDLAFGYIYIYESFTLDFALFQIWASC